MKNGETWKPIGPVAKRLAARLVALRDGKIFADDLPAVEKKPVVRGSAGRLPANVQSGGDDVMAAGVLGKNALRGQGEERTRRASANRGDGALIVGTEAHHEFGLEIAPSRRDPTARQSAPVMRAVGET